VSAEPPADSPADIPPEGAENEALGRFGRRRGLSFAAFALALLVYACFGTPTPDQPGLAEITVGFLLICAAGPRRAMSAFTFPRADTQDAGWRRAAWCLLIYGLSVPVAGALAAGRGPGAILRDLIPFIFMLMPLFLAPLFAGRPELRRKATLLTVLAGAAFAARVVAPWLHILLGGGLPSYAPADPFYLANAPTVLFAAVFLAGAAAAILYRAPGFSGHVRAVLCLALAFFPLAAMALVSQRASIGYVCLCALVLAGIGFCRRPLRALWPALIFAALLAAAWPELTGLIRGLWQKTAAVGINERGAEAMAVIRLMQDSLPAILFGKGWGAMFASPAVGGVTVNFTHSLLTSFFLKSGLCGLFLALSYLFLLCRRLPGLLLQRPVLALALAGPVAIDTLLYASFKSLDFGLILLLAALWREEALQMPQERGV
jgi:hypothetical protein